MNINQHKFMSLVPMSEIEKEDFDKPKSEFILKIEK